MWSFDELADVLIDTLESREHALRAEQAVYGLDALSELDVHELLAHALVAAGLGVLREQAYPHEWARKRANDSKLPERCDRLRCDLVLTPHPGSVLDDAVVNERARRADRAEAEQTLFSVLAPPEPARAPNTVMPEDALWVEIKAVAQHALVGGVLTANRTYSSLLTRGPIADLTKLDADERIRNAASVTVLFAQSRATAEHDLNVLTHRVLDKRLAISSPVVRGCAISDRIGNGWCALGVLGMRR